jgi:hypothetical protein
VIGTDKHSELLDVFFGHNFYDSGLLESDLNIHVGRYNQFLDDLCGVGTDRPHWKKTNPPVFNSDHVTRPSPLRCWVLLYYSAR